MEISDVLTPGSLNIHTSIKPNAAAKENKFKRMLETSMATKDVNAVASGNAKRPIDTKLMNTCIEMESIFVSKMLKEMRNSLPKEKLIDGGMAENIFEDMLYDEYALNLSKTSNLGLGKLLYNELSRK
jgi:Rod binding domain-containing protein